MSTLTATPVTVPSGFVLGGDLVISKGWIWTVNNSSVTGMSLSTHSVKTFATYRPFFELNAGAMWSVVGSDAVYLRWDSSGRIVKISSLRTATAIYNAQGKVTGSSFDNDGATCTSTTVAGPDSAPALSVSGNAAQGFSPGVTQAINVVLTNAYSTPVTVYSGSLTVSVSSSNPSCSVSTNFVVRHGLNATVTIPGSSSKSLSALSVPTSKWPTVAMIETHTDQDACQGANLTFTYSLRYSG